jgi:hypothetical protein
VRCDLSPDLDSRGAVFWGMAENPSSVVVVVVAAVGGGRD